MSNNVATAVYKTDDYSIFKTLKGNRVVNQVHVAKLEESFRKNYLMSPILVNEKYEIIDGQHRFYAAEKLGLPINFIIMEKYGLEEVQTLNTNTANWKAIDYLNAYCDVGHPNYLKFREFMELYPNIPLKACEVLLTQYISGKIKKYNGKKVNSLDFKNGLLEIPDFDKSIALANKLLDIEQYYKGFNRLMFVRAYVGMLTIEEFDHKKFISKLETLIC